MVNSKELRIDLALEAGLSTERFPETSLEATIAESALAKEMEKLSMEEQERHLFELHGISGIAEEDPQMVAKALEDLQVELDKLPAESKDAYEQAKFLNPAYVHDAKFRLMFLRCHEFDIPTTAKTIAYHFNFKRELFGDGEILARDVRQSDLSPKAMDFLNAGIQQVLPHRDASGRAVMMLMVDGFVDYFGNAEDIKENGDEMARAFWYSGMAMLDEEAQIRGTVFLAFQYQPGNFDQMDFQFFVEVNKLDVAVPYRSGGWHYCYILHNDKENEKMRLFLKGVELFTETRERLKMRIHEGTHEEIKFKLQTYGVPMADCPIRPDGTWDNTFNLEWVKGLRAQEEQQQREAETVKSGPSATTTNTTPLTTATTTMIPTKCDVLFGKNMRARDHAGNMRALNLVEDYFEAYNSAGKARKTEISNEIIAAIKNSGGRFLKQSTQGGWEEVTDTVARQKIAHWCRHLRHKKNMNSLEEKDGRTTAASMNTASKRVTPPPQDLLDQDEDRLGKKPATTVCYEERIVEQEVYSTPGT